MITWMCQLGEGGGENLTPSHKAQWKIQELFKNEQLVGVIWFLFILLLVKFPFLERKITNLKKRLTTWSTKCQTSSLKVIIIYVFFEQQIK